MKKGDYFEMTRDVRIAGTDGLQSGQIVRCERGGKNPKFAALMRLGNETLPGMVAISLSDKVMTQDMRPSQPVADHPLLEPIAAKIKTFPQMSEETEALDGTIRIPGEKEIHVHNDGHGGMTSVMSYDRGVAVTRLEERLRTALVDAGLPLPDPNSYENLAEEFVSFRTYTAGLETFADYVQRGRARMNELSAKYGFPQDDLDDAMKGPASSGSPSPKA